MEQAIWPSWVHFGLLIAPAAMTWRFSMIFSGPFGAQRRGGGGGWPTPPPLLLLQPPPPSLLFPCILPVSPFGGVFRVFSVFLVIAAHVHYF